MLLKKVLLLIFLSCSLQAIDLNIVERKFSVNGKEAAVYAIEQPDGTQGIRIDKNDPFNVRLKNHLNVPSSVHWHGLILPNDQDGVAFVTQYPIYPGQFYHYQFPLVQAGTFWMHSHYGLQEQRLLSAPLIITEPEDAKIADQEVILFLTDFSFTPSSIIFENLKCKKAAKMRMGTSDLTDVDYDAFLTNRRALQDPEIVEVKPGTKIRLRIINGSSGTNFFIHVGKLSGEAIAVDGNRIKPFTASEFELADAQRIDVVVKIPEEGGVFPILAQGEGTDKQTGLILVTRGNQVLSLSEKTLKKAGGLTNVQESLLEALYPLPSKPVDKQLKVELGGDIAKYIWTINGQAWPESTPLVVEKGQRIEILFKNTSGMAHPMHLHGHIFQVKAIDGKPIEGAVRDTVLVMPNSTLAIQFDANNPGVWPLHCHLLYHLEAGMFTVVRYADFQQPLIEQVSSGNF